MLLNKIILLNNLLDFLSVNTRIRFEGNNGIVIKYVRGVTIHQCTILIHKRKEFKNSLVRLNFNFKQCGRESLVTHTYIDLKKFCNDRLNFTQYYELFGKELLAEGLVRQSESFKSNFLKYYGNIDDYKNIIDSLNNVILENI